MLWLYRYFTGYLQIILKGDFVESVLNLCAKNRISLWNSRLVKNDIVTMISIKDFKKLRSIIRKSGVRIHILKKHGFPFIVQKNRKRTGVFAGLIIMFVFLEVMSGYIWIIDVTGNEKTDRETIISACKKIGITEGIKSDKINSKVLREKLLLECNTLSWGSLNVEGSRLTVNVSEINPKETKESLPCNLLSNADGIIKKIDITSGNCLVKTGDTVKKGDILVSGIIENAGGTHFVVSHGSVFADTKREFTISGEYIQTDVYENGERKIKKVLELFSLKIPLYLGSVKGEYNSSLNKNSVSLFSQSLPISVYSREFRFLTKEKVYLTENDLINRLENQLKEKIKNENISAFTVEKKDYIKSEQGITLKALISAEENIAVPQEITVKSDYSAE